MCEKGREVNERQNGTKEVGKECNQYSVLYLMQYSVLYLMLYKHAKKYSSSCKFMRFLLQTAQRLPLLLTLNLLS